MAKISLRVNGKTQTVDVEPEMPLLYVLRNDLQLNGPKIGCGLAKCGSCTRDHGRQRDSLLRHSGQRGAK